MARRMIEWLCPKPLPGLVRESQPLQLWNKTGPSDMLAAFSNLFPICLFLWCYHIQESTKSRRQLVKAKAKLPPLRSDVFSTFYCCMSGKEVIQEWTLRTWYPLFFNQINVFSVITTCLIFTVCTNTLRLFEVLGACLQLKTKNQKQSRQHNCLGMWRRNCFSHILPALLDQG